MFFVRSSIRTQNTGKYILVAQKLKINNVFNCSTVGIFKLLLQQIFSSGVTSVRLVSFNQENFKLILYIKSKFYYINKSAAFARG